MLLPGSGSKDLFSETHYWNKVRMAHCQVMKSKQLSMCTNEINSDNSKQNYIHLSNGLIKNFEICYIFRV